jgi:hypothetical protein
MQPWMKHTFYVTVGGTLAFVGIMGFAHTPWGAPILALLHGAPGCPAGFDTADPNATETFRAQNLAARTESVPPAKAVPPTLGFELGRSTRADVAARTTAFQDQCRSARQDSVLLCSDIPSLDADGLPIAELHLQFDAQDRLVAIDLFRQPRPGAEAAQAVQRRGAALEPALGPPRSTHGNLDGAWLEQSPLRQAALEYAARGYTAHVSATNFGPRGIRVREQYQWADTTLASLTP